MSVIQPAHSTTTHPRRLWWRDDDFTDYFSTFNALERTAERLGARPLVAAIPGNMASDFRLRDETFRFAIHGWKHVNHGCTDQQKSEYGRLRAPGGVLPELLESRRRAQDHFSCCLENWFVPPFNRLTEQHFPALLEAGFDAFSTSGDESYWAAQLPSLKLPFICVDAWSEVDRQVKDPLAMETELESRLCGRTVPGPLGLMTHHKRFRVTDWERFDALIRHLRAQGWLLEDCDAGFCANFPRHCPEKTSERQLEGWSLSQRTRISWR